MVSAEHWSFRCASLKKLALRAQKFGLGSDEARKAARAQRWVYSGHRQKTTWRQPCGVVGLDWRHPPRFHHCSDNRAAQTCHLIVVMPSLLSLRVCVCCAHLDVTLALPGGLTMGGRASPRTNGVGAWPWIVASHPLCLLAMFWTGSPCLSRRIFSGVLVQFSATLLSQNILLFILVTWPEHNSAVLTNTLVSAKTSRSPLSRSGTTLVMTALLCVEVAEHLATGVHK